MGLFDKLIKPKQATTAASTGVTAPNTTSGNQPAIDGSRPFVEGLVSTKDIIAPSALEVDFDWIRIDNKYQRTVFVAGYPRFVGINWLSPLINFDASLSISMYIYPTDGKEILDDLRRKIAEMEAEISTDIQRGRVVNPATQAKLEDALTLQADLVKGEERFFQYGLYATISSYTKDDLNRITKNLEAALGALMIITKKATLQMEDGFVTTLPLCSDRLKITRNMDTTSLATTFPFVSSDLSDDKGIMYGINEHNGSLVIFDRFSMPNYNSVVFASAGAGKSYMIKLEAMRSLMLGSEIIVIDPENEYKNMCEAVGGQYIAFGYGEESKINPFDLSLVEEEGENALNTKMLNLHKLFKVMIGEMDPMDESILDRAVMDAYKMKGITPDPETQTREAPLIEDLYKSLIGMEDQKAQMLAARFEKYIKGSFAGIFNQKTTVNLQNKFVVFGIRNLEETLRPVAMHIILDYIWTVVKKTLKRRILIVDEAWYMMQYPDSASFLRGIVKRGRKYYLGVTTITQDVDDFLETPFGKEIVTNSSIQILLKQHSAAIDQIAEVFYLSEGEKQLLLSADKGEGIFFAGQNHVAIQVIASEEEHKLITSNPEEVMKMKQEGKIPVTAMKAQDFGIQKPTNIVDTNSEEDEDEKPATPSMTSVINQNQPAVSPLTSMPASAPPASTPVLVNDDSKTTVNPAPTSNLLFTQPAVNPTPVLSQQPTVSMSPTAVKSEEKPLMVEVQPQIVTPTVSPEPTITVSINPANSQATPLQTPKTEEKPLIMEVQTPMPVSTEPVVNTADLPSTEELLSRKISMMEEEEKKVIEDHQQKIKAEEEAKKKEEEEKKKMMDGFGGGGLPKYQDLFKSFPGGSTGSSNGSGKLPPLPPLPPLPKFDAKKLETGNAKLELNQKTENIIQNQKMEEKPVETKPQETQPARPFTEVKVQTEDNAGGAPKKDADKTYEDLFGNGIV